MNGGDGNRTHVRIIAGTKQLHAYFPFIQIDCSGNPTLSIGQFRNTAALRYQKSWQRQVYLG